MSETGENSKPTIRRSGEGVRALLRGLEVLRYVNAAGSARASEIARALQLPRPTVYRLIETLEEAGYLAFSGSSNLVRVTRLAASLGDSSARHCELLQISAPILAEFSTRLIWPLDLTVYDNAAMVVQETTHVRSPFSIDRAMTGFRLPMLRTSAGRAYLAFCDDAERSLIVDHIQRLGDPADAPFLDGDWLERMICATRERGYALRDAGEFRSQTAAIAVPVVVRKQVLACVSMIWIRSAIKMGAVIDTAVQPIKELAAQLADRLSR